MSNEIKDGVRFLARLAIRERKEMAGLSTNPAREATAEYHLGRYRAFRFAAYVAATPLRRAR